MESVVTDVGLNTRYGTTEAHRSVSPAESAARFCQRWMGSNHRCRDLHERLVGGSSRNLIAGIASAPVHRCWPRWGLRRGIVVDARRQVSKSRLRPWDEVL